MKSVPEFSNSESDQWEIGGGKEEEEKEEEEKEEDDDDEEEEEEKEGEAEAEAKKYAERRLCNYIGLSIGLTCVSLWTCIGLRYTSNQVRRMFRNFCSTCTSKFSSWRVDTYWPPNVGAWENQVTRKKTDDITDFWGYSASLILALWANSSF